MKTTQTSRRDFLKRTAAATAIGGVVPYFNWTEKAFANDAKNDRPRIGCIGVGSMGTGDARGHANFGDVLAVCDVDSRHAQRAANDGNIAKGKKVDTYKDYRHRERVRTALMCWSMMSPRFGMKSGSIGAMLSASRSVG